MRRVLLLIALLVAVGVLVAPLRRHLPLDPDEPLAQDGSLAAGRARTIVDVEPALGAFDEPKPPPDPDESGAIQETFEIQADWTGRRREEVVAFLAATDGAFCDERHRQDLITAMKGYYAVRARQRFSFSQRGPRAKSFIEAAWSTPVDRRIDRFARLLVISGTITSRDIREDAYPEFAKAVADIVVTGDGCASMRAAGG
jgi:hypothetical protein